MKLNYIQFQNEVIFEVGNKIITLDPFTDYLAKKMDKIYIVYNGEYEFDIAGNDTDLGTEFQFQSSN